MKQKKSWAGMKSLLHPHRGKIAIISALTVLESLLQVALAVLTRFVIDAALAANGTLAFWGAVLVIDLMALVAFHALLNWYAGSASDKLTAKLRHDLLTSAAYSRDARLHDYHSGELLSRGIEDVNTVCDGAMYVMPSMIGQLTRLVASFAAVLFIYPPVAAVLVAAAVIIGGIAAWLRPVMKRQHRTVRQTEEKVLSGMQENLQQLELIQSLQVQEQVLDRFDKQLQESLRAKFVRRLWSVGSNGLINTASQIGTGVLLLWGASQVANGALSYGSLTSIIQLMSLFRGPVLGLSGLWTRLASVEVAGERLQDMLMREELCGETPNEPICVGAVVFENVTFSYPGDEVPVLRQFNARFPLDGWACLTGISGKGKSTLFKLILGLYFPQEGRVYLETDRGALTCSERTRHLFAYVPQDYALFSGTIRENLQLVAPEAAEDLRRKALVIAQADFVWELTAAEQTSVRENNTGLSKGQIQRLAIARAVLMERPIFLLDECTSALDAQTEENVLRNLQKLGKSAILVTHRPAALEGMEKITLVPMDNE